MPRSANNAASRDRRRKVLKRAKGFVGGRRKLFRTAQETVYRAMAFATRDRKVKKRTFRRLWNVRINAGCREHGTKYSVFIAALKAAKIDLNRKSLAELAARDTETFKAVIEASSATK